MKREQLVRILENGFTIEWLRLTHHHMDYKTIKLIEDSFLIEKMLESINSIIKKSETNITSKSAFCNAINKLCQ